MGPQLTVTALARNALLALSKKLVASESVSITSHAKGCVVLAKARATMVPKYSSSSIKIHTPPKRVTCSLSNKVTVRTVG